jgi:ligand-binding sensor protein
MQLLSTMSIDETLNFQDLVDITGFERLLEKFFLATGIPNGLVGRNGEVITKAGWVDACDQFHRGHPDTDQRCQESNLELMRDLQDGETAWNICGNGLIDYAAPVVIDGRNLATLFLGQGLDESPGYGIFSPNGFTIRLR